jgi:uncharacterized protein (TIGR03067 family)
MSALDVQEVLVPASKLKGTTLLIKDDVYSVTVKGKKQNVRFLFDSTKEPKWVDMYFPDGPDDTRISEGIYKIEAGKLIICRGQAPGSKRPRDFVSSATNDNFVVTWERK